MKASEKSDETTEEFPKSSETSKASIVREVTALKLTHFLLDMCDFAWPGEEPTQKIYRTNKFPGGMESP